MDCNTARLLTTFFGRHGSELAGEDAAALEAHLAACANCAPVVAFERAFDDRIAKAMTGVPVPAGLKGKILDGVAAQRGSWYRQKAVGGAALAAAIMLAFAGVTAWRMTAAPQLDQVEILAGADRQVQDPRSAIDAEMARHGVTFEPERPFDLNLFDSVGTGSLQGRTVPVVTFRNVRKNAIARVYVVRSTDFKWANLPQDGSTIASVYGHQVIVVLHARRGDTAYVVVYTGEGLELFLENRSSL